MEIYDGIYSTYIIKQMSVLAVSKVLVPCEDPSMHLLLCILQQHSHSTNLLH